jgi:hypothetical protein
MRGNQLGPPDPETLIGFGLSRILPNVDMGVKLLSGRERQ